VAAAAFTSDGRRVLTLNDANQVQVWDLSPDERPLDDLERLVRLLSGREIDASGASIASRTAESDWLKLKAAYPDAFTVPAGQALAWRNAEDREREWAKIAEGALYNKRGEAYVQQGRLAEAAEDFARAIRRGAADVPPGPYDPWTFTNLGLQAPSDHPLGSQADEAWRWTNFALARLALKDDAGYRRARAEMLKRFGKTEDDRAAHFFLWNFCLVPGAEAELRPLLKLAQKAAAKDPTYPFHATALGLLLYRAGRFEEAVKQLNKAMPKNPSKEGRGADWFFLAMSHHRLGHTEEAKKRLAKAVRSMEQAEQPAGKRERLELEILHREAEALINGKATGPRQ
jgi:tetratricopeptide (TPR) repeat protein